MADHLPSFSHDTINRQPLLAGREALSQIAVGTGAAYPYNDYNYNYNNDYNYNGPTRTDPQGHMVFNDRVLNHSFGPRIGMVRRQSSVVSRQWSSNQKSVISNF